MIQYSLEHRISLELFLNRVVRNTEDSVDYVNYSVGCRYVRSDYGRVNTATLNG